MENISCLKNFKKMQKTLSSEKQVIVTNFHSLIQFLSLPSKHNQKIRKSKIILDFFAF